MTRLWLLMVALSTALSQAPARAAGMVEPANVVYLNRWVYTMRASVAGASPAQRAERAVLRLRAVPDEQLGEPVTLQETVLEGEQAVALKLGNTTLITVLPRDLDPEAGTTLEAVAAVSAHHLAAALTARRQMQQPQVLLRGVSLSLLGLPMVLLGAWLARRLLARIDRRLRDMVTEEAASHRILGVDWSEFGLRAVAGTMRLLSWGGVAALAFLWAAHSLRQFPLTRPLADGVRSALGGAIGSAASALWRALPDLATIVIVVLAARGTSAALDHLFTGIGQGRLRIPGIHPETARATRRLAVFGVWGLTLAVVYPYIPGSESEVFRGFSVFLGFMFTLGSTGVVSQWMQGLVLVYSRALRVGDFVRIGDREGVVLALGALSVKLADHRGNEVTLPNSSVVAGSVVNHSRLADPGGVRAWIQVTIGYDVAWRQVHDLLLHAAAATPGVRSTPAPKVFQRALSDFAVEYEMTVEVAGARLRAQAVSGLHAQIQDGFKEAGVAILSPHFVDMPSPGAAAAGVHTA